MRKRCTKGKSCGATCIDAAERCVLELGPLLSKNLSSARGKINEGLGDIFNRGIEAGKKEKPKSVPQDLKNQLAALGGSPQNTPSSEKIGDSTLDEISRILRGEGIPTGSGTATGNTRWARDDAQDFDGAIGKVRREGRKDYDGWKDSYGSGAVKIGEGSFGNVIKNPDGTYVKRGDIGDQEAALINRLGKLDLGPKLIAADINGPANYHTEKFVDVKNGRIAMGEVAGKPMGSKIAADEKIGGKNVADIYWKAMADMHRQGIAHNDAHIDNIMIDNKGKGRWVDMGLAQASPKAALAEAMGVFKDRPGGDEVSIPSGAKGEGNWQTSRWKGTGVKEMNKNFGTSSWQEYQQRFPVASRVWDNQGKVIQKMEKMGMDVNEINSVINHGIRSTPDSYAKSDGFGRMTDAQAQDLLNTLYNGI